MEKVKHEETPGLHHVPFTLIWMSTQIIGLFVYAIFLIMFDFIREYVTPFHSLLRWLDTDVPIAQCLAIGLLSGMVALITQSWLLRQRYGFTPRGWRILTLTGYIIASIGLFPFLQYRYDDWLTHGLVFWFSIPILFQMFALRSVVRGAWLWILIAAATGLITTLGIYLGNHSYNSDEELFGLISGTLAQAFFTASTLILLMTRQRKVNIKAKVA